MAQIIEREVPVAAGDTAVSPINPVTRLIYFITAVIEAILVLRLLFRVLGANPANAFVNMIYSLSRPLVAPFFGIFNVNLSSALGTARFEIPTIVAIVVYALIGYLLAMLFNVFTRPRVARV